LRSAPESRTSWDNPQRIRMPVQTPSIRLLDHLPRPGASHSGARPPLKLPFRTAQRVQIQSGVERASGECETGGHFLGLAANLLANKSAKRPERRQHAFGLSGHKRELGTVYQSGLNRRALAKQYYQAMRRGAIASHEPVNRFTEDAVYIEPFSGEPLAHVGKKAIPQRVHPTTDASCRSTPARRPGAATH
jgi:hypothetical protein